MTPPFTVLLAEDDEDDLFLSKRVLRKAGLAEVAHVWDGRAAMEWLTACGAPGQPGGHARPDLVLLDLKMPVHTGHEVLEWLRARPALRDLRVYVLTSSDEPRDRGRAERAGADGYFVKPLSAAHVVEMLRTRAEA